MKQIRLLLQEGRKAKEVSSSPAPSPEVLWWARLESVVEARELGLQVLFDQGAKHFRLYSEARRLRDFVEALGQKKMKLVILAQAIRSLAAHSKKIEAGAEAPRKQKTDSAGGI